LDKVERGHQAELLLQNDIFKELLNDLDGKYHALWRQAKTVEAREDLHRYVKVLERISTDLQSIANTGKLEQRRQNELTGDRGTILWPKKIA